MKLEQVRDHPAIYIAIALAAFVAYYEFFLARKTVVTTSASVPGQRPGLGAGWSIGDSERPNWIPPSSPEIILDPLNASIPSTEAGPLFTQLGTGGEEGNTWLYSPRMADNYYMESIPEEIEVIANEERVPWGYDNVEATILGVPG